MEYPDIKMERVPVIDIKEEFPYHYNAPKMDETSWLGVPGKFARTFLNTNATPR